MFKQFHYKYKGIIWQQCIAQLVSVLITFFYDRAQYNPDSIKNYVRLTTEPFTLYMK